jgi:tetratricopeptide (TPR) repeat protein
VRRLDECLALRPSLTTAAILKSQVYLQQKNYAAAVENATQAFQMDPQNGVAARQLASSLFERNRDLGSKVTDQQLAEADRAVGLAMVLNPGEWQLQSVYAETLYQQDPQRALAMRQVLLKTNPNPTNAIMLANMAIRQAQNEKDQAKQSALLEIAGNAYEQAWQMAPSDTAVQTAYAEYLRITNQRQKAVEIFAGNDNILWRFYFERQPVCQGPGDSRSRQSENTRPDGRPAGHGRSPSGLNQWDAMKTYLDILAQKELTVDQELWLIQKYLDSGHNQPAGNQAGQLPGAAPRRQPRPAAGCVAGE